MDMTIFKCFSRLACSTLLLVVGQIAGASETIRKEVVMSDEKGRTIEVIQVLRANADGSYTVVKIEPEQEANDFFNRACREEYGPNAQYIGLENEIRIYGTAGYTYSCKSEQSM